MYYKKYYICEHYISNMSTIYPVRLPTNTDMVQLKKRLKTVKQRTGKTANAKIAAYILKLAK